MPDAPQRKPPAREGEIEPWALAGLGLQFGVALVIGVFAGQWVDRRIGTAPFGMLVGTFVLGGGVFIGSYRRLMAKSRRAAERDRNANADESQ